MQPLTPAYDNKIAQKYSAKTLDQKSRNKIVLQEEFGWVAEPKRPLMCIPGETTKAMNGELLRQLIEGLLELPVELIVRGKGSDTFGAYFSKLESSHKHCVRIMPDDEEGIRKMLAASDMALFAAAPTEENVLENTLRYGAIAVAPQHELLENYNPVQEAGNAFVFAEANVWHMFAAVVRALETFKFPFDWRTIQRHAMETVPQRGNE